MSRPLALATSIAALCLVPAAASASSTRVGHPQAASPAPTGPVGSGAYVNVQTAAGSPSYVLPAGILTAWSFYGDGTATQVRAKVFRPDGAGKYSVVAQSPLESVPATAGLYSFSTRLTVRQGDLLGLAVAQGATPSWGYSSLSNGDIAGKFFAEPQPADPAVAPFVLSNGLLVNVAATVLSDADNDGLADDTEDNCPFVANPDQANTDGGAHGNACDDDDDNDGAPDTVEAQRGTSSADLDTDDDGLGDNAEPRSDPRRKDTDGDGLTDGVEQGVTARIAGFASVRGTDGTGFFPVDRDPRTKTDPRRRDTDGDRLIDGIEDLNKNGRKEAQEMSPLKADTDNDRIVDGREDANRNGAKDPNETNPLRRDTDRDGLADGAEDRNRDGRRQRTETDPRRRDTDRDGASDRRDRRPLDPRRR